MRKAFLAILFALFSISTYASLDDLRAISNDAQLKKTLASDQIESLDKVYETGAKRDYKFTSKKCSGNILVYDKVINQGSTCKSCFPTKRTIKVVELYDVQCFEICK